MGADVSMLGQLESLGAVFSDEQGKTADCLAILKSGGINWIRLRIWNDPVNREDVVDGGRVLSRAGDPVGGGNDDLAACIRIAKRAKKLGLKVLADFHYSDFWADPSKQNMPFAWKGLSLDALKTAVYDFTRSSLKSMRAAGAAPDMVQIGNEVDGGFLWPVGKLWQSGDETVGGQEGFVALLKEAIRAVRESDRRIRIMIHASNGGDNALFRKLFDPLVKAGVDFDVINPDHDERYREYWQAYYEMTKRAGVTQEYAKLEMRRRHSLIGAMMIHKGDADGMICGTFGTTKLHLDY
ncbi:MAG: phosphate acyltransferase, partial [Spirochaetia bacterium]